MSKHFLSGGILLSALLLATSCSNDDVLGQSSGEMATVSFAINTDGAVASRAISDGSGATELHYAVYRVDGGAYKVADGLKVVNGFHSGDNVSLQLAKGQEYAVAFWAQNPDAPYTLEAEPDGPVVNMNYDNNAYNNTENRDAFFGCEKLTVSGNETKTVTLKRPFAQVNVGASDYNANHAQITNSSVEFNSVATSLNLIDGTVEGNTSVTFGKYHGDIYSAATSSVYVPTQTLTVDGKDYTWLSMCYVLPTDKDQSTTVSAKFTFEVSDGEDIVLEDGLANMPIQRNYRTNIVGNVLTNNVNFNVVIDKNFQTPSHNIQTATELESAAINGGNVTLSGDVVINKPLEVKGNLNLNLNGYTLTYNVPASNKSEFLFTVQNATLTLDGGNIVVNDPNEVHKTAGRGVYMNALSGGKIIINGGSYFVDDCTVVQADGGEVEINGGSFDIKDDQWGYGYMLNIKDHSNGKIVVKGGKFHNFDPANNTADGNGTNYVKSGYKTVANNGWYYVITNNGKLISSAQELIEFGNDVNQNQHSYHGQTIALANDIDMTGQNWTPAAQAPYQFAGVFDGYGHTIKNLNINSEINPANYAVGFFGWISGGGCVKNVNFENATVKGLHWVGVVAGYLESGLIENVTVNGSKVSAVYDSSKNDDGDKAGGICGFINRGTIKDCKVTNSAIDAVRDAGQIVGCANNNIAFIINPTASNVTVTSNNSSNGTVSASNIGGLVGSWRN